ncbi:AAA family ATPase [Terrabacter carboxydivorans]|uniref:NadR/Ttd14 AAA domain-containing protein n=1 Tax=Terrabacter carboxydivorans TaxID=619730 RepID=A0ABN3M6E8_9MICO
MAVITSHLDGPVDAVFTSDAYGEEMARRLGATWVQVDPGRASTPISGTAVRADVAGSWWALPSQVRAWFAKRVVVVGAESTGTTTLAEALGAHYGTSVAPDFLTEWALRRPAGPAAPWHTAELDLVAREQASLEDAAAAAAPRPLVVCATDVFAATLWHERLVGSPSPSVRRLADERRAPALYVLTDDEIAVAPDAARDGDHGRAWMRDRFREELAEGGVPWLEVRGSRVERLAAATAAIDAIIAEGWRLTAPVG